MPINFDEYKELVPIRVQREPEQNSPAFNLDAYRETDNEIFFETRDFKTVPSHPVDIFHQTQAGELTCRFDLISGKYYNTVNFWWAILDANNIVDVFDRDSSLAVIRVPALLTIYGVVNRA